MLEVDDKQTENDTQDEAMRNIKSEQGNNTFQL